MGRTRTNGAEALRPHTLVQYERLLWAAFFTPMGAHPDPQWVGEEDWGARLLLWGPPGSAKTASLRQLARMLAALFYSLKPGAKGEGIFGVTPVPVTGKDGETYLSFPAPIDMLPLFDNQLALVALDEATTAGPALQAPLLGMLQEKEMGSRFWGPRVRVMGAANEVEDAAGGHDLASATANRLCHIPWEDPSVERHNEHLISLIGKTHRKVERINAEEEEKRVLEAWPEAFARAVGLMTAFSSAFSEWHRVQPPPEDPNASKAWCSPRTKEYACRALASSYVHGLNEDTRDVFMAGYVGQGFVDVFGEWASRQDIPNAAEFLDGKISYRHDPHRLDRTAALLNECAALVVPEEAKHRDKRSAQLFKLLEDISDDSLDVVANVVISTLHDAGLTHSQAARTTLKKLRPMLDALESVR